MNAFNLPVSSSSGPSKPYVKYDGRAGRMIRIDRAQNSAGEWSSTDVDITNNAIFVADFANARTGWISYPKGAAPIKNLVKAGTPLPPRPADLNAEGKPSFRAGFEFDILLQGETVPRELGSTAQVAIDGFGAAYGAFLAAPEAAVGKLPVLKLAGAKPVKSGQSTNYEPVLEIAGWIDRPSAFDAAAAPTPVAAPAVSAFVAPPAAVPAATPAGGFGFGS
jgi:hypothetical protein